MAVAHLRVLVAAADPLVRAGLRAVVSAEPGLDVVADAGLHDGASVPMSSAPDVMLVDAGEHAGGTVAAWSSLGIPLLVLASDAAHARAALGAGAQGALIRGADGERLAAALRAVAAGLQVSELPERPADEDPGETFQPLLDELTARESEVLQLLAAGLSNKAIARRLSISEHTVKFHLAAIMGKLGTHSRTETLARAARAGLIVL